MRNLSCGRMREKTAVCLHLLPEVAHRVNAADLRAFQGLVALLHQADAAGDVFSRPAVIAGDHLDLDAGLLRHLDGLHHPFAHRVFHPEQSHPGIAAVIFHAPACAVGQTHRRSPSPAH